jgi:hypothetical protein
MDRVKAWGICSLARTQLNNTIEPVISITVAFVIALFSKISGSCFNVIDL